MTRALSRIRIKPLVGGAVLLLLAGVVIKRAFAPPPSRITEADVTRAQRTVTPKAGADEKTSFPADSSEQLVAGNGIIEPADRETRVSSHIPGRIAHVRVSEGDFVEAESDLLELDNAVEKAGLDAAEADVAAARAELARTARGLRREDVDAIVADTESIKARAAQSKTSLQRIEQLARAGAATADELDRAKNQAAVDERALAAAEARRQAAVVGSRSEDIMAAQAKMQSALARRDQAKATYERTRVRAPLTGRILQIKFRAGEYFNPNGQEPLIVMGDTRTLRVRMDLDERDVARVRQGQSAFVQLTAYPNRRFTGRVADVARRMGRKNIRTDDPTERIDTKILEVLIDLDPAEGLVPGLRVTSYVTVSR